MNVIYIQYSWMFKYHFTVIIGIKLLRRKSITLLQRKNNKNKIQRDRRGMLLHLFFTVVLGKIYTYIL